MTQNFSFFTKNENAKKLETIHLMTINFFCVKSKHLIFIFYIFFTRMISVITFEDNSATIHIAADEIEDLITAQINC